MYKDISEFIRLIKEKANTQNSLMQVPIFEIKIRVFVNVYLGALKRAAEGPPWSPEPVFY